MGEWLLISREKFKPYYDPLPLPYPFSFFVPETFLNWDIDASTDCLKNFLLYFILFRSLPSFGFSTERCVTSLICDSKTIEEYCGQIFIVN